MGATILQPRLSLPSRFGLLHTVRPFTNPYATGAANYTFILQTGSEAPFDWVRLVYMNHTASAYTIGAATIAASAHAPTNGYTAVKADGSTNPPTAVTFNNAGANGVPPSPAGSTGTLAVGARTGTNVPALAFSDWMQVSSVAPDDGGTFHHLVVRTHISAGAPSMPVAFPVTKLTTEFPTISGGRNLKSYYASGDQTAASTLTANGPAGYVMPVAVQFYSRKRGLVTLETGDSQAAGYMSTADHNSGGFQAARLLSSAAFPVFYVNHGYTGQLSADFYLNAKAAIDAYSPDVALLQFWSSNDTPDTQAKVDASFARGLDLAHYCVSKGTVPILKTSPPFAGSNAASDALRTAINSRILGLAPGFLVADYDAVTTDGANPARIKTALNSGDGVHLNDAGYAAEAGVLLPILRRLMSYARAA